MLIYNDVQKIQKKNTSTVTTMMYKKLLMYKYVDIQNPPSSRLVTPHQARLHKTHPLNIIKHH